MAKKINNIEDQEDQLQNEVYLRYFDKVMAGEEIPHADLDKAIQVAKDAFEEGASADDALYRAVSESEDEKIWRQFSGIKRDKSKDPLITNDPDVWFPNYKGETIASQFDKVIFQGEEYEKNLRYTSLHEVTQYKNLSKKEPLRGSSSYKISETGELEAIKRKLPTQGKETDWEISPNWWKWVVTDGLRKYDLREDMLSTHATITAFEAQHKHEYKQLDIFGTSKAEVPEPKKYTGRIKNPFWEFWAKYKGRNVLPATVYTIEDEVQPAFPLVYAPRIVYHENSAVSWWLDREPAEYVWPAEIEGLEMLKPTRTRNYTIPRSKVRSKAAAFFQVQQSKKFMAFYTVSFPAGIPDDLAYKLFNTWLTRLRNKKKGIGLKSYLWVAERQEGMHKEAAIANFEKKRANALEKETSSRKKELITAFYDKKIRNWKPTNSIHFHLLTNNYMPVMVANHYMKAALKTKQKEGWKFLEDFDTEKYNGVDVKHVGGNRQRLGYYLTKYITKNETAIDHAVWRTSRDVSALFTEQLTEDDKRYLMWKMLQDRYCKKEGTKAPMYRVNGKYVDKTWLPPWIFERVNGLLVDTNEKIYKLFEENSEGTFEDFLTNAYKQTPKWAIYREIERLRKRKKALFRKDRLKSALKVAKRKEKQDFFRAGNYERGYHKKINARLKNLMAWAEEEGCTI